MPFDERIRSRYCSNMRRRILALRAQCESSLDCVIDRMMLEFPESYIKVEKGLGEIDRMVTLIEEELLEVRELVHAQRLEAASNLLKIASRISTVRSTSVPNVVVAGSICLRSSREAPAGVTRCRLKGRSALRRRRTVLWVWNMAVQWRR